MQSTCLRSFIMIKDLVVAMNLTEDHLSKEKCKDTFIVIINVREPPNKFVLRGNTKPLNKIIRNDFCTYSLFFLPSSFQAVNEYAVTLKEAVLPVIISLCLNPFAIISLIPLIAAGISIIYYLKTLHLTTRNAHREATQHILDEWFSEDQRKLRRYFFQEFIALHRNKLIDKEGIKWGLKDIEKIIPSDEGRMRQLCYFFDRVGWYGSTGLIDVDYVLGPMQHVVRRTWIAMEPLIKHERKPDRVMEGQYKRYDPVFLFGFEWLFKRTSQQGRDQASLLGKKLRDPKLLNKSEISSLRKQISADEEKYYKEMCG